MPLDAVPELLTELTLQKKPLSSFAPSPFHDFSVIALIVAVQLVTIPLYFLIPGKDYVKSMAVSGCSSAIIVLFLLWVFRLKEISLRHFFGTFADLKRHWQSVLLVVPLLFFSIGTVGIVFYGLSTIAPTWLDSFLASFSAAPHGIAFTLFASICGCLFAPFAEETLFRGVFIYRFDSYKQNVLKAVVWSSVLFAAHHPQNIIGTFVMAYVVSTVYIHTRTLWIPILIHVLNNSLTGVVEFIPGMPAMQTVQEFHNAGVWVFVALTLLSAIPLAWYVRAHRITPDIQLPYFANLETAEHESSAHIA